MKFLSKGYDIRFSKPGEHEKMACSTCGAIMNVRRNVNGPTSFAAALAKSAWVHDEFTCPNAQTDWHSQVVELIMEADRTVSNKIKEILMSEAREILRTKTATLDKFKD